MAGTTSSDLRAPTTYIGIHTPSPRAIFVQLSSTRHFPKHNFHPFIHRYSSLVTNIIISGSIVIETETAVDIDSKMKISFISAALAASIVTAPTTNAFSSSAVLRVAYNTQSALFSAVDDKTEVREYFNNEGFNRWNKIYSESDEVNNVQLDIRKGHDMTIQKILNWVKADGDTAGKTFCDCGCGVGSLAIPLAQMGELFILDWE